LSPCTSDINIFFEGETIEQFGGGDVLSAPASRPKETPNNASAAGGIGSCGIILDAGAAENALRPWKRALYWAFQGRFLDQDRVRA
jgi:hypothetical protein